MSKLRPYSNNIRQTDQTQLIDWRHATLTNNLSWSEEISRTLSCGAV